MQYVLFAFDKLFVHVLLSFTSVSLSVDAYIPYSGEFPQDNGMYEVRIDVRKKCLQQLHMYYLTPALEIETLEGCL